MAATPASATLVAVVAPTAGPAPIMVSVAIVVSGNTTWGVELDFGDGAAKLWYNDGEPLLPFSTIEVHEYNCPGEFTLTVTEYDWVPRIWQIDVAVPTPMTLIPSVTGGELLLITTDVVKARMADKVVVDWGDGTPLEEFRWKQETEIYISPTHTYTVAGDYTVIVTNQYIGPQCGLSEGASLIVTVENPNPVSPTTWGRVKVLYR
jgi:hypothetical protein